MKQNRPPAAANDISASIQVGDDSCYGATLLNCT
jgi:hypothetical protein